MTPGDTACGSSGPAAGGGLPHSPAELRRELVHRLALAEREVRALAAGIDDVRVMASVAVLEEMEREIKQRLALAGEPAAWSGQRAGIVELWRRHRREFERLAGECRRKHPARSGRRKSGPRW